MKRMRASQHRNAAAARLQMGLLASALSAVAVTGAAEAA